METLILNVLYILASFLAVAIVLSLHEFSHAFVAYKCGDSTPKLYGRITLNPLAHFDMLGLIMFTVAGFGWAKPVPINPYNFNHYKRGLTLTALAGVAMNYLSAFLFYPLCMAIINFVVTPWTVLNVFLVDFTSMLYTYSIGFCVFNLIPLPPLDGWRVCDALNRRRGRVFRFIERYGSVILLILIGIHFLANFLTQFSMLAFAAQFFSYIDILGYVMVFATKWLAWPIYTLWGLVF